jgi:hypothetical protein
MGIGRGFDAAGKLGAVVVFLAICGADGPPPAGADRPDRRPIPDPPHQGEAWTPPETALPRFLVSATEALFAQGVPDPRGCEYREVEPDPPGGIWLGVKPVRTRMFVLPEIKGDDRRFAIDWDGLLTHVREIGPAADLAADVRAQGQALRKGRAEAEAKHDEFRRPGAAFRQYGPGLKDHRVSPMEVCLLLRLGRADLAEALFAAATPWTPDGPRPDLTDYGVSYLSLAVEWAGALYARGITAHGRGDDALALDAFRRVAAFRDRAEAKAAAMGFPRPGTPRARGNDRPSHFPLLTQFDELLADQERRAQEPPRGPIPGRNADPAVRVAALILNLDEIAARQYSSPGAAHPSGSPLVRDLIAMGDPAVEPLLEALARDTRLTRSISYGRAMPQDSRVSPTFEAIVPALDGLMKAGVPGITPDMRYRPDAETRRAMAAAYRKYWEANRAVPPAERYYRILADDAAADRWLAAATGLTSPTSGRPSAPMLGEPLRRGREPSVTALLTRRVDDLIRRADDPLGRDPAYQMTGLLAKWDLPASLPVLHAMMRLARSQFADYRTGHPWGLQVRARDLARFTLIRARAGDRAALDEYAAWIRATPPDALQDAQLEAFEPMWTEPDHPAIAEAARAMFADPGSPWRSLIDPRAGLVPSGRGTLETSPLIRVPAFRETVFAGLGDKAEVGTVERRPGQSPALSIEPKGGTPGSFGSSMMADLDELPVGEKRPVRACDCLAWRLASLDGTPRFEPYWPQRRRDEAIAAFADFLRRFGDRYEPSGSLERPNPFESNPRLAFPKLDRPATAADVEAGRAIFSLAGQGGEVRVVPLPEIPRSVAWTTLEDTPLVVKEYSQDGESRIRRDFDRSGRVWQAEEVKVGDAWRRYYGFVGAGTVGRAPAEEVVFYRTRFGGEPPEGRFGVEVTLPDPPEGDEKGFPPGAPLVATVRLRNLKGLDQSVPTEFVRHDADGKPALRRGIALKLTRGEASLMDLVDGGRRTGPPKDLAPTRVARFTPGDAARTLGPAEAFEAFRIDLRDWFDLSRSGSYHLVITFGDEAGLGPGVSGDVHFRLGE